MFARGLAAGGSGVNAEEQLRRLYYDLAGSPGSNALAPLLEMTERSHILYGSDYVHTPEPVVAAHLNELMSEQAAVSRGLPRDRHAPTRSRYSRICANGSNVA